MAELFARDPREVSDAEFTSMIEELRKMRAKFVHEGGKPSAPKALSADQKKVAGLDLDIKL
jgi:hypothetical protein